MSFLKGVKSNISYDFSTFLDNYIETILWLATCTKKLILALCRIGLAASKRRRIRYLVTLAKCEIREGKRNFNSSIPPRHLFTSWPQYPSPSFHVGLVMLFRPPAPPILDVGHLEQEAVAVVEPHCQDVLVVARSVPHAGDDHVLQGV